MINFQHIQERSFTLTKQLISITVILTLLFCCGCSDKVPLTGKVTFTDDGSSLTTGTVCFVTEGFIARGHLKSDGTYKISSTGKDDGLPPGTYKVYLVDAALLTEGKDGNFITTPLVDSQYENPNTSNIECKVDAKTRQFDFTVERAGKR